MKKVIEKLRESGMLYVVIGGAVILIIAIIAFLGKGGTQVSGWQILINQTGGEWFRMIFFTLLAGALVFAFERYYKREQDMGRNTLLAFAFAFMTFFAIAFGKGCTDKANEGVTSGNGRPSAAQLPK